MSDDDYQRVPDQKKELPTLDEDQVAYATEMIRELHPIDDTPLCEAFPWLGMVCGCLPPVPRRRETPSDAQEDNEQTPLLSEDEGGDKKKKKKKSKSKRKRKAEPNKEIIQARPIAYLGFGIVAYLDILWTLIWTFALYSVFLIPTMSFYASGTQYNTVKAENAQYELGMLGNVGYSTVQCAHIPVQVGKLNMQCPYGTIGTVIEYGINPSLATSKTCIVDDYNKQCRPDGKKLQDEVDSALGQGTHLFTFVFEDLFEDPSAHSQCNNGEETTLFVQYTCEQAEVDQHEKYNQMAIVTSTGVLIAFLFTVSIRYLYQGGSIQQLEWDMSTVTAGDYTVELKITLDAYNQWKESVYMAEGGPFESEISPGLALKDTISGEVEALLDEWCEQNPDADTSQAASSKKKDKKKKKKDKKKKKKKRSDEEEDGGVRNKVADIVFSFNNAQLIKALRARGQCIATQDFDGMRENDSKVQEQFQNFESLTVPTSAFITFESDDSKNVALAAKTEKTVLGMPFEVEDASEPTDIIWENRHFTPQEFFWRKFKAALVVILMLFLSFLVIYFISAYSAALLVVFPQVDCEGIASTYGADLQSYAVIDFEFVRNHKDEQSSGCLQCFCAQEKTENPDTYLSEAYGQSEGIPICKDYQELVDWALLLTSGLSYLLIGINYVLREVCIAMVNWVGYSTETLKLSRTTTVTFIVQFFNSAFLLLLVNANLSEQFFSFGLVGGSLPDFNAAWYRTVGNIIVGAMMFNLYYPLLEAVLYYAMRLWGRFTNRRCGCDPSVTKSTSIQGYIDTYAGPVYFMHFKYSSILTITFITMMYGVGMPILFPIACASFIVLYLVEKILLFYGYRLPPMYDERLSQNVLQQLQFAPILYCLFGYWMASNQQLLSNDHLVAVPLSTDVPITEHYFLSVFTAEGWQGVNAPLLFAFVVLVFFFYLGELVEDCFGACCPSIAIGDVDLDEDIDNYWASLDDEDRKWSLMEEQNARELLTSKLLLDSQYERLQSIAKTKGKTLQGVHSYDILANPLYLDDFQYVTAAEENRDQMIIDDDDDEGNDSGQSDLVRVALNLAFLTEDEAKNFQFTKAGLRGCKSGNLIQ